VDPVSVACNKRHCVTHNNAIRAWYAEHANTTMR